MAINISQPPDDLRRWIALAFAAVFAGALLGAVFTGQGDWHVLTTLALLFTLSFRRFMQ